MTDNPEVVGSALDLESRQVLPMIEHLARLARRDVEAMVGEKGLRSRHLVAMRLLALEGPSSQRDLTDALSLDPSNMVGLLNDLEGHGLVTRRRDPSDRRRHIVELSSLGEAELRATYRDIDTIEDQLFSALTETDRAELYRLLSLAIGSGSQACDEPPTGEC